MYAIVEIKGKQYKAEEGAVLKVDLCDNSKGDVLEFDSVMMLSNDGDVKVGEPYVSGAKVKAVVEDNKKDKKVIVYKYKRRKGYMRKQGHRQQYSYLKVQEIVSA